MEVKKRMRAIVTVVDIDELGTIIDGYDQLKTISVNSSNNSKFNAEF